MADLKRTIRESPEGRLPLISSKRARQGVPESRPNHESRCRRAKCKLATCATGRNQGAIIHKKMARGAISRLISEWQNGDPAAESALFEALYEKLHQIALARLRSERLETLGPTALVHEAYVRLRQAEDLSITDSQHFLYLASRVMRRILVDRARARLSEKRGGEFVRGELVEHLVGRKSDADEIMSVDRALTDLAKHSPRQAQLVELRYFAGFSEEEAAKTLGLSARTVRREWQVARTRLRVAINGLADGR